MWSPNPLLLREKLRIGCLLRNVRCCVRDGFYSKKGCVSTFPTHFDVGIFLGAQHVGFIHLVSRFGTDSCLVIYLEHPCREGSSGTS